jgi:hypothetical protein
MLYRYPKYLLILVLQLEDLAYLVNPEHPCFLGDPVYLVYLDYLGILVRQ